MIGERLNIARKSAGLSLRDLEEEIGKLVTFQAIQKYEANEAMPGSPVLRALARALGVTERYLLNPRQIDITGVQFRAGIDGSAKQLGSLRAQLLSAIERYIDVEELVPGAEIEWGQLTGFPYPVLKIDDVEVAAGRLRAAWNLGSQPISDLPELLEERGIKVVSLKLDPKVSAILCTIQRGNHPAMPLIAVNVDAQGEHQRFGLARELAHLVLDFETIREETESVCERFARAFLMLHDVFISAIGKARKLLPIGELFRLKAMFGVAAVQIVQRCMELGIINAEEKRRLFAIFAEKGWTKAPYNEPYSNRCQRPSRFERLCLRAFAEDLISESRAAELLGVSTRELTGYFDEMAGAAA
jgi:Zn-dependent peptidase ImmA (M78 family)/transcriptional regulator with XRE-family HTH domain